MSASRDAVNYAGPACPRCSHELDLTTLGIGPTRCPFCFVDFEAAVFTPPASLAHVARTDMAGSDGATACPQHPRNAAVGHCERCGILTCALCRIEADRMRLCPACFERLSDEGALASTRISFRDNGRLAVTLSLLGLALCFVGVFSGPASIYYGIRARQQRLEMNEPEGAWQLAFVTIAGLAQFGLGLWLLWFIVTHN